MTKLLGILCGLQAEDDIASVLAGARVVCSAAVPAKARELARDLVKNGATHLMSFGVAGALDPKLRVGDVIVGNRVLNGHATWSCDPGWGRELAAALPYALRADVWGSETLVPTAAEKVGLYHKTGCAIVDMESQCAAEVSAEAGLPLAVVRVVCDEAEHNVPSLVMAAINSDGSTNYWTVITSLLKAPHETLDLIKVGHSMAKALRVLKKASGAIGTRE